MLQRSIFKLVPNRFKLPESRWFKNTTLLHGSSSSANLSALLSQFETSTIQQFFSTSSADLFLYIDQLFQLSKISNYRILISALHTKDSDKFNRQAIDVYILAVSNLISKYPMMFNVVDYGGTTHQSFTKAFLEGIYPQTFRQAVQDKGPENLKSALKAIYGEFTKFAHYNDIIALTSTKVTTSSEGKVADIAISAPSVTKNVRIAN
jgi:hypothetical protein